MVQHRQVASGTRIDLACRIMGDRILEKGIELDLHSTVHAEGSLAWESVTTFYYRGRFGKPEAGSSLAETPPADGAVAERWHAPTSGGVAFGRLSGDYNGIHLFDWYARRLGFPKAFVHPPVLVGQALARIPQLVGMERGRIDVWMKGPVPYGSHLALRLAEGEGGGRFALLAGTETRPAIVGQWTLGVAHPLPCPLPRLAPPDRSGRRAITGKTG
jgi:hypothetical protein